MTLSEAELKTMDRIVVKDINTLEEKGKTYGHSWKSRGGIGAFMMLARKWDRLENILACPAWNGGEGPVHDKYDIFAASENQNYSTSDGSVLAEVADLRRYLLLVETELTTRATAQQAYDQYGGPSANEPDEVG